MEKLDLDLVKVVMEARAQLIVLVEDLMYMQLVVVVDTAKKLLPPVYMVVMVERVLEVVVDLQMITPEMEPLDLIMVLAEAVMDTVLVIVTVWEVLVQQVLSTLDI